MTEDIVLPYLADGLSMRVLDDWCPTYAGYKLYYPSQRNPAPGSHSHHANTRLLCASTGL